jgi:hypothetical protein
MVACEGVNPELIAFAKEKQKPFVDYSPMPDIADPVNKMYESIMILDD